MAATTMTTPMNVRSHNDHDEENQYNEITRDDDSTTDSDAPFTCKRKQCGTLVDVFTSQEIRPHPNANTYVCTFTAIQTSEKKDQIPITIEKVNLWLTARHHLLAAATIEYNRPAHVHMHPHTQTKMVDANHDEPPILPGL